MSPRQTAAAPGLIVGRRSSRWARVVACLTVVVVLASVFAVGPAHAAVSQPSQPAGGPGGRATAFGGVRAIDGGQGVNAWEILLPARPAPPSAPLVVVMHGYYEFSGYSVNGAIAQHTALKGNVVIYPRWQTAIATPCPGPFDITPCITSATTAIHAAIAYLRAHPRLTQPRLGQASYFGFSFGGIITANMLNEYRQLHLPKPRAVFLDDPADGGVAGPDEHALDPSLAGIPSSTKFVCHSGSEGAITLQPGGPDFTSCNAVFPKLGQIPTANKSLVMTFPDNHGSPALASTHGVCAGPGAADTTPPTTSYPVDAYDWGFCWRSFDALRTCALDHDDCGYALGNTAENRYIGTWSDGTPIIGLKVQEQAPIRSLPIPPRQPQPPRGSADTPPTTRITPLPSRRRRTSATSVRGTASSPNGVAFVEATIARKTKRGCRSLSATGALAPPVRCDQLVLSQFAIGTTRWSMKPPQGLRPGTYVILARAIDSFGQTAHRPAQTTLVVS